MALNFSKLLSGKVAKKSGEKTYKVVITEKKAHPIYRKIVSSQKAFLAHSETEHEVGEIVNIVPVTKISKRKYYMIVNTDKISK